ncbi:MAG: septum formation initiator [Nocardioides sp.]|nr:septum formation initiator [Nocardioides sp.]
MAQHAPQTVDAAPAGQAAHRGRGGRWRRRTGAVLATAVLAVPVTLGTSAAAAAPATPQAPVATPTTAAGLLASSAWWWTETTPYGQQPGYGGGPGAGSGYGYGYGSDGSSTDGEESTSSETSDATDEQSTGLVLISTELGYDEGEAAGSGIILGSDGLVVTNHHVVEGATDIEVTIATTGETYAATLLGADDTHDVAVLQLEGVDTSLSAVDTDTAGVSVGDDVTAVGDAYGDGGSLTAAPGVVTATGESITVSDEMGGSESLSDLIEVDADIVPGDSGGALLDTDGDVVGMNVAASSGSANVTGYVIPISTVLDVVDQVESGVESADVTIGYPAFLGVELASATGYGYGSGSGTTTGPGVTVSGVIDDTAAAEAGLTAGDTITSFDGTSVTDADALSAAVAAHDPGEEVTVTWTDSSGTSQSATVTLGTGPVA